MLIILEGPDGAGKSTLAQQIVTRLAVKYPDDRVELLHRGPPTAHPLDEYVTPLLNYRPHRGHHIVCDRWHWGEMIYPRVLDRRSLMDRAVFNYIELFLQSRGGVTFFITQQVDVLKQRLAMRGDDMIRVDQIAEVSYRFHDVHDCSFTGCTLETATADVVCWRAAGAENSAVVTDFVTPVGRMNACSVLVLGDVRACGGLGCRHSVVHNGLGPAFMPYRGTSGHYLFSALTPHKYNSWAFANACDVDDLEKMWWQLNRPRVVTLGVNADRAVTAAGIAHGAVPHPQYVRRFHHAAATDYGELIRDVAHLQRNELKWRP